MPAFTISDGNHITVYANAEEAAQAGGNGIPFESQPDLAGIVSEWPVSRLVEVYNGILGNREVTRFANRAKAVARIWAAIQPLADNFAGVPEQQVDSAGRKREHRNAPKPQRKGKAQRSAKTTKAKKPQGAKTGKIDGSAKGGSGSKKATVIAMMKRAKGVTLSEIMAATGWQAHTVRGMVSILGSKGGIAIASSRNASGERTYCIPK